MALNKYDLNFPLLDELEVMRKVVTFGVEGESSLAFFAMLKLLADSGGEENMKAIMRLVYRVC